MVHRFVNTVITPITRTPAPRMDTTVLNGLAAGSSSVQVLGIAGVGAGAFAVGTDSVADSAIAAATVVFVRDADLVADMAAAVV
jgi:hypothetical protein